MSFSDLKKAVDELSDPAKQKLTEMGLETFSKVKITSLHTRKGLLLLMLKSDVQRAGESFSTHVSEERIYHITPDVVQQTFDFKNNGTFGADKLGKQKDHTSVFKDFVVELEDNGFAVRKHKNEGKTRTNIDVPTLIKYMKKIKENEIMTEQAKTEKLVFLFCCILVTKILLPTTSNYVVPRTVWMCSQEELLRNLNWCNLICLDIKNKIKAWQKKPTRMTATLAGCLVVPLVRSSRQIKFQFSVSSRYAGFQIQLSVCISWNMATACLCFASAHIRCFCSYQCHFFIHFNICNYV
jgi:hypothetical protein